MDFQRNQFYHIISYGCQANVSDSEHYAGQLEALGYHHTEDLDMADVILVNTCCVRETAEDKTLGEDRGIQAFEGQKSPESSSSPSPAACSGMAG